MLLLLAGYFMIFGSGMPSLVSNVVAFVQLPIETQIIVICAECAIT